MDDGRDPQQAVARGGKRLKRGRMPSWPCRFLFRLPHAQRLANANEKSQHHGGLETTPKGPSTKSLVRGIRTSFVLTTIRPLAPPLLINDATRLILRYECMINNASDE